MVGEAYIVWNLEQQLTASSSCWKEFNTLGWGLEKLQTEIVEVQKEILPFKGQIIFETLDSQLNEKLDKMVKNVIAGEN